MPGLDEVFARDEVAHLAGPEVYARGVSYLWDDRVESTSVDDGRVRATVRGSVPYEVELWTDGDGAAWSCSCPYAEGGEYCKHAVAVALSFGAGESDPLLVFTSPANEAPNADDAQLLDEHLDALDRSELIALVHEAADNDWRLRERLLAAAHAQRGTGPDLATWRRRIEAAFAPYGEFVTFHEAPDWVGGLDELIDALDEQCEAGHPDAVAMLAAYAHRCADDATGYVDGSDSWLDGISVRLAKLHLRACAAGEPDPIELARRLVELEVGSELEGFHRACVSHAEVLGAEGIAEYRRLLAPRWKESQARDDDPSGRRSAMREAMIGVALAANDPDELIEVSRHDLRGPAGYLEVARALAAASRHDDAERWAREGLEASSPWTWQTSTLRDFLAELLRARGEAAAAIALYWDAFERLPSLSSYRRLVDEAGDGAAAMRQRAAEELAAEVARGQGGTDSGPAGVLVEILAYEGETERAWQVASDHGCDREMWLTLARAREEGHPLDAIAVYEREAFVLIEEKQQAAYRRAVELLARMRQLTVRTEQPERFIETIQRIQADHRRKRNLMRLIDDAGWAASVDGNAETSR